MGEKQILKYRVFQEEVTLYVVPSFKCWGRGEKGREWGWIGRQTEGERETAVYIGDKTLKRCLTGKEGNGI